ncbi:hypothetical protein GCM10027047_13850 [Rhodococcus aerolatus]
MSQIPTGADVLAYLGWPSAPELIAQADQHVETVKMLALAHTRGRGLVDVFGACDDAFGAVILSAAARSLSNPSHARRIEAGSYNEVGGVFSGWTLVERVVLDGLRRTAG